MSRLVKLGIYACLRYMGMFRIARRLNRRKLSILCYHGGSVCGEQEYNALLFMRRDFFASRLDLLERWGYTVVSLDQALEDCSTWPRQPLVITFDDGWRSTYTELLPELVSRQLPSTLYLSSEDFLYGGPVLSVAVRYVLFRSGLESLDHGVWQGVHLRFSIRDEAAVDSLVSRVRELVASDPEPKAMAYRLIDDLGGRLGLSPLSAERLTRAFEYLSVPEVEAAEQAGCRIELHGHVHQYPRGQPERLMADVTRCSDVIEPLIKRRPRHYCYPSGEHDDVALGVFSAIAVVSATTCLPGLISRVNDQNRYRLPRFLDGERIHGLELEAELSGVASMLRSWLR